MIIVKTVVNSILEWTFHYADKTSLDLVIDRNKSLIEFLQEKLKAANDEEKEQILNLINKTESQIEELPKQTEKWYSFYTDFCDEILPKLMEENILCNNI